MKLSRYRIPVLLFFLGIGSNSAQQMSLAGDIFEYATYYISSFDPSTGATDVQIFRYTLSESDGNYPVNLSIWFRASVLSPSLGINSPTTIIEVETETIDLQYDIVLDNRDISSEATTIYDMAGNDYILEGDVIESLDPSQVDAILQSILASGKIADGEYTFEIKIKSGISGQTLASDSKTIFVQSPVSISLEYPGGTLSDTLDNVLYSTFPIFQWYSQSCAGCETFIRVTEFNSEVHSSLEEAMDDQRVLPFDQSEEWYLIDNVNSFQYPFSGAYPLEEGKVYGWQIMITLPTTIGQEEMASAINAFKIGSAGTVENTDMFTNPFLMVLQEVLGDDQFNAFFGSGNMLQGYNPTGQFEMNGITVDEASVGYILSQIENNTYQIQSVTVE